MKIVPSLCFPPPVQHHEDVSQISTIVHIAILKTGINTKKKITSLML